MADFLPVSCSTRKSSETGVLASAAFYQRPHALPRTEGCRKGLWPRFPLLAAAVLFLSSAGWHLGYYIEVSVAERGVYVPAGILKSERSFEQKRVGRRRVSFEDQLSHEETKEATHGRSQVDAASFEEAKVKARGLEGPKPQKQGVLRGETDKGQKTASYSTLERHTVSVHQHADNPGVYERQSSESSNTAEESTAHGELEEHSAKGGSQLSRATSGSLASLKEEKSDETVRRVLEHYKKNHPLKKSLEQVSNILKRIRAQEGKRVPGSRNKPNPELEAEETEALR